MKKILIVLLVLLVPSAYAEELYAVKKPNGSVSIIHYQSGANDTIQDVIHGLGYDQPGYSVTSIKESDIPKDREDRDYWTLQGKKIVTDEVKKQEDIDAETAKEEEKQALLSKLGITKDEAVVLSQVSNAE